MAGVVHLLRHWLHQHPKRNSIKVPAPHPTRKKSDPAQQKAVNVLFIAYPADKARFRHQFVQKGMCTVTIVPENILQ